MFPARKGSFGGNLGGEGQVTRATGNDDLPWFGHCCVPKPTLKRGQTDPTLLDPLTTESLQSNQPVNGTRRTGTH